MTTDLKNEVMELAKKVAAEHPPKKEERGVLDAYIEQRKAKDEEAARQQEALREFYGLDKK
ncbi:MAG: hypothetical protein SNG27_08490 [Rikenellaceae bacterium]